MGFTGQKTQPTASKYWRSRAAIESNVVILSWHRDVTGLSASVGVCNWRLPRPKCSSIVVSIFCMLDVTWSHISLNVVSGVLPNLIISNPSGATPAPAGFRNSNPARSTFGDNLFCDHKTIRMMKLMVSTMLPAAIKRQYSVSFVSQCLPVCHKTCGTAMNFVLLLSE